MNKKKTERDSDKSIKKRDMNNNKIKRRGEITIKKWMKKKRKLIY